MKALSLDAVNKLSLRDIEKPVPGPHELLIRTRAALICTSDINDLRHNPFSLSLPVIIGHEAAGLVDSIGNAVTAFAPGDRVATHPVHPCGKCHNCLRDLSHLCSDMRHFGINMQGVFADWFVVREDRARRIGQEVSFKQAALAEPVAVCLEAIERARLTASSSLLIIGDGPFGVLMARLALDRGAAKVVLAGHHDFRLGQVPGALGVNTRNCADPQAAIAAHAPHGYDAAILAVGNAEAVRTSLSLLAPRGRAVLFSAIAGQTALNLMDVHIKELEILGACNDHDLFDTAVDTLAHPSLAIGDIVTHTFALADYEEAFKVAESSHADALKVAFIFDS